MPFKICLNHLLTLKHPLGPIYNPLNFRVPLLHHLLHELARFLKVVRQYAPIQLILPQLFIMRLACALYPLVCVFGSSRRGIDSGAARFTCGRRQGDLYCEGRGGFGSEWCEGVWGRGDGGGYGFYLLDVGLVC